MREEFDVIMAWWVDRLGRSLRHQVEFLFEMHAKGVDLYLPQQGIDTTTSAGDAMFQYRSLHTHPESGWERHSKIARELGVDRKSVV